MGLLSDQLLKAGIVTEKQVKKAEEKPNKFKRVLSSKSKKKPFNKKVKQAESDLAQFYKQRDSLEKSEKQEAARRKKEINTKINKRITATMQNVENAEVRYNFVVGTTIKYVFVTETQQQQLAEGELAITFLGGKRAIIPVATAKEIQTLNPKKIVVLMTKENSE